jgi:hypothetical protein
MRVETRKLREFGFVVGGVFAGLAAWGFWRDDWTASAGRVAFLAVGGTLVVLGTVAPRALELPQRAWMGLARLLARVTNPVLLTVFFFAVITPVGLIARLVGHDAMGRRRAPDGGSYWKARQPDPRGPGRYLQQF